MAKGNTEIKVEINGVPDIKAIPKAALQPVIDTLLENMLKYFIECPQETEKSATDKHHNR